jgi:hypothetical protein
VGFYTRINDLISYTPSTFSDTGAVIKIEVRVCYKTIKL